MGEKCGKTRPLEATQKGRRSLDVGVEPSIYIEEGCDRKRYDLVGAQCLDYKSTRS